MAEKVDLIITVTGRLEGVDAADVSTLQKRAKQDVLTVLFKNGKDIKLDIREVTKGK